MTLRTPRLRELGIAAGVVAILLFAVLGTLSESMAILVAGCGLGAILLTVSLLHGRQGSAR